MTTETIQGKRARLLEAKAKREAAAAAAREAVELAELELEDQLATETGGVRGVDYEIVVHGDRLVGVKRGPSLAFKAFQNSKQSEADVIALVKACAASPPAAEVGQVLEDLPALGVRVALAIAGLFGAKLKDDAGK